MRDEIPKFRERGAEPVIIGNGQTWQARGFVDELNLEPLAVPLYVDPALNAYRAAGLRRGATKVFSPGSLGNAVRALRGGHRQKGVQGDAWQLGGVFVLRPDDTVLYTHVNRTAGDHAPPQEILQAL